MLAYSFYPHLPDSWWAAEVRRAHFGPGLWPGPHRQVCWGGRGLRGQGWALAAHRLATRRRRALDAGGPPRTMRGVPALVTAIFCCDLLPGDRPTCRERDG